MVTFFISVLPKVIKNILMLFNVKLLIFVDTFPSLGGQYAAGIGFTCRLLDGEGGDDLQSFCPHFVTNRSSRLNDLLDPARACRLCNPVTFKSLDCFCRS